MRVISGTARGRSIIAPKGLDTRPITDRAKEAIFNMLDSLGLPAGATVADLYAGSGSFGIECLSRGASSVQFVEKARPAVAAIQANLTRLGFDDGADVRQGSVLAALPTLGAVDLVFCDPPYVDDPWANLWSQLEAKYVVAHADHRVELGDRWVEVRRKKYGRSHVVVARIG